MPKNTTFGSTYRRGRIWWVKYYAHGKPVRESARSERKGDALALLRHRMLELESGLHLQQNATVSALLDGLVADYELNARKSTARAKQSCKHLRAHFGDMRARQVGPEELAGYVRKRKSAKATNGTINREFAALRRAFRLAHAQHRVSHVPAFPKLKESPPRGGFFEWPDFVRLRDELPDHLKGFATFAYLTGMRRSEIVDLRWSQVDLLEGWIHLESGATKNDEARDLPIFPELRAVLEQQRAANLHGSAYVFQRHGKPVGNYYKAWRAACKRAKVPGKLVHDFRRTAARNLRRAGVAEEIAMRITGHKTREVFRRYNITDADDLRQAGERLSGHLQAQREAHGHNTGTQADSEGLGLPN